MGESQSKATLAPARFFLCSVFLICWASLKGRHMIGGDEAEMLTRQGDLQPFLFSTVSD